jgi:hypothetical protein
MLATARLAVAVILTAGVPAVLPAQALVPAVFDSTGKVFGRPGDWKAPEGVYVISFPRGDLDVSIGGVAVPTGLGFTSWIALRQVPNGSVAMSDMVLLPDEVDPVIAALQSAGIEVTALHRHFQHEEPQVMYLHSHATGDVAKIAAGYRAALAKTGTPMSPPAPPDTAGPALDTDRVARIVGHEGQARGKVYKITVGRDDLHVRVEGAVVTTSMGLNSWAAFIGTDADAHVAGDVAMLTREVAPVVRALEAHDLEVVSIHNHMLDEDPRIVFLHYWGSGPVERLARGFRVALDVLGHS